jgi:heme exporter protein D
MILVSSRSTVILSAYLWLPQRRHLSVPVDPSAPLAQVHPPSCSFFSLSVGLGIFWTEGVAVWGGGSVDESWGERNAYPIYSIFWWHASFHTFVKILVTVSFSARRRLADEVGQQAPRARRVPSLFLDALCFHSNFVLVKQRHLVCSF